MTPTPEQVVAACQRAGIPVRLYAEGLYIGVGGYAIRPEHDTCPGSALFIVAVLGALPYDVPGALVKRAEDHWGVRYGISRKWAPTLTAACMAAIVAAYPPKEAGE